MVSTSSRSIRTIVLFTYKGLIMITQYTVYAALNGDFQKIASFPDMETAEIILQSAKNAEANPEVNHFIEPVKHYTMKEFANAIEGLM